MALDWLPINTAPTDGTPILVFLEQEFQGSRIHAAVFDADFQIIGNHFAFDMPEATHWKDQPDGPTTNQLVICDNKRELVLIRPKYLRGSIVKHRKNGEIYRVVIDTDICRIESSNTPAYAYERVHGPDRRIWVRSQEKMEDGRFARTRDLNNKLTIAEHDKEKCNHTN